MSYLDGYKKVLIAGNKNEYSLNEIKSEIESIHKYDLVLTPYKEMVPYGTKTEGWKFRTVKDRYEKPGNIIILNDAEYALLLLNQ